jgi:hypothetical protein
MATQTLSKWHVTRNWTGAQKLSHYSRCAPSGCIVFTGTLNLAGYGRLVIDGKGWLAHRYAWTINRGPIPQGMYVCHHCDNPPCTNPDHLFLGTQQANVADMVAKGRHSRGRNTPPPRGSINGNTTLTEEDAMAIFRAPGKQRDIAARYGISKTAVCMIKGKKTWRHIHSPQ